MLLLAGLGALASCKQRYYTAQGKSGNEKRDRLVEQLRKGREEQEKAKAQYQATLAALQAAPDKSPGKPDELYTKFKQEVGATARRAKTVSDQIAAIEQASGDMFAEWERELAAMHNGELKNKSIILVRKTREQCGALIGQMKAVEAKAQTVLKEFEDQVLFLEHNMDGEAVSSVRTKANSMDAEVKSLAGDIEASTREADAFIASLPRGS